MARYAPFLLLVVLCAIFSITSLRDDPTNDLPVDIFRREMPFEPDLPQSPLQLKIPTRRILVTGGGGNVGKHLVRQLLESHTAVTVVDLIFNANELDYGTDTTLLTVFHADIRNATALDLALTPDVVGIIHLAAVSRVIWCLSNEPDCMDVNEGGTAAVLAAIERQPESFQPWFILASSSAVYGENAKRKAEDGVLQHAKGAGRRAFHAALLRFSPVYGGLYDHNDRLVTSLVTRALAHQTLQIVGGEQELNFVHINDCVDALTLAATRLERKTQNAAPHAPPVTADVFDVAGNDTVSPIQSLPRDLRFPVRYNSSLETLPGYVPKITLEDGLVRFVGSYLDRSADYLKAKVEKQCGSRPSPDLLKLDGCTANLLIDISKEIWSVGFDRNPKQPHKPDDMGPGTQEDYGLIWVVSARIIPDSVQVAVESRDDRSFLQMYTNRTYASHRLGVYTPSLPEFTTGFMFDHIDPEKVGSDTVVTEWEMIVNESKGTFKLALPDSGYQVSPPSIHEGWFSWISVQDDVYPFRLSPICCPAPPPWPFYEQDPIQHSIHFDRFSTHRPFYQTIPETLCVRTKAALVHTEEAVDFLAQIQRNGIPPDSGRKMGGPFQWVDRGLPPCTNDCEHPTVCVDTGDCACTAALFCRQPERFPFSSSLHSERISYPPSPWPSNSLLDLVQQTSWLNVLRPESVRYISTDPSWPKVHIAIVDAASEALRGPNLEAVGTLMDRDCFSADASLELALRGVQTSVDKADIIFQPYYHSRMWTESGSLESLFDNLTANYAEGLLPIVMPLTYDWGLCMYFTWTIWDARKQFQIPPELNNVIAWSVMGDLNSPCYRFHQDVLIPPRSCRSTELRPAFSNPAYIRSAAERSKLSFFSGTAWGSGGGLRKRILCDRRVPNQGSTRFETSRAEMGFEPKDLRTHWKKPTSHADYVAILNDTVFCAVPAGVAGWAPRIEDAIYAGCIPVMFDDSSHLPFWDMLDWAKFSVRIYTNQVQYLEEILMAYSLQEIQQMQANLVHVRDILTYPLDGNHADMITMKSPLSFAVLSTRLRLATKWPCGDDDPLL
ncbi:hypothetical protein FB45DRAFT_1089419 [Roridomyces roridus]|uniref:Uncharacterized protein n=1 Tax=Roridomyces roridus TaxID=1738132 RepID=A0AAD7BKW6_9AGAR|nr:hypothetical protein FB45DRAFT_1089419 [Roridomyces roridus]